MSETKNRVAVTGIVKFATLKEPQSHPDHPESAPRYRIEFNTPKANEKEMLPLKQAIAYIGKKTWTGAEATKRMRAVQRTITDGDGTSSGQIGLLDGDAYKPEYNAGQWVIRAGARESQKPVFRRWDEKSKRYALSDEPPKPGDLVKVLLEVWAMAKHSRINFTVKAIQVMQGGESFAPVAGGVPVTEEMLEEEMQPDEGVLGLFAPMAGKAIAAGTVVDDEDEDEEQESVGESPKAVRAERKKAGRPKKAAAPPPPPVREPEILGPEEGDDEGEEEDDAGGGDGLFDDL